MVLNQSDILPDHLFRLLFEKSPGSILLKADPPNFTILAVSDDFLRINAVEREEVLGKGFFESFPEDDDFSPDATSAYKGFMSVIRTGEKLFIPFLRYDIRETGKDTRQPHYWSCTNAPIFGPDNKVAYILKNIIDITGEVKAKETIIESENRLLLAAKATGLGIWDLSIPTMSFRFSPQIADLFGHPPGTTVTLDLIQVQVHPDDMQQVVVKSYFDALESGHYSYEARIYWPDKSMHWIRVQGIVVFNDDKQPEQMLGTIVDITESKRDEIRKNDFIAMASHELKTPLTSLKAYIQLLETKLQGAVDPFVETALFKAGNQVNKMTALIHSFLDLSKLEPGKIQLKAQTFDVNKLVEETIAESRAISSTHELVFDSHNPVEIEADREKIAQVLSNLISNAIKYSPKGSTVTLGSEVSHGKVTISVKDEGVGIKQKDQEKIFQRFYRVDDEDMKHISGFGIGLYLSSEIIQRHKGRIGVRSKGKGSTFYFTLPLCL